VRAVNLLAKLSILLLVAMRQIPSEECNGADQDGVAAQVDGESLAVAGSIAIKEDLGTSGVTGTPCEEVHGNADRLLRLPSNITCQHGHSQTLCSPESEDNPVTDEKPSSCRVVRVFHCHDDNGADEGWNHKDSHSQQILTRLLAQPRRTHQCEDDNCTKHHGEKLGLEDRELQAVDNNVVESTESRRRQCSAYLDEHVAVGLGIEKSLLELIGAELPVLETCLVGSNAFNHELLVLLREALGAHGRVYRVVSGQSPKLHSLTL
jgi:hypothetical protein